MEILLKVYEDMLLRLLCAALNKKNVETSFFESVTDKDWGDCFSFAKAQGVMALAWDGVLTLPLSLYPPRQVKLSWAFAVEKYEKKYEYYEETIVGLTDLFRNQGISTVQLKGIGLSLYYPIPKHREGGDIDIYTCSANKNVMSDKEANLKANRIVENMGIKVDLSVEKHSEFFYNGIPVENHKYFLEINAIRSSLFLDTYLKKLLNPHTITSFDNIGEINVPSYAFNTLFLSYHAIQHLGNGLCLHHLCDWVCLLNRYGLQIPQDFKDKHVLELIYVFTQFANCYLGTAINVKYSDELLKKVTLEILRPVYPRDKGVNRGLKTIVCNIKGYLYKLKLRKEVLEAPIWYGVFNSIHCRMKRFLSCMIKFKS